jgi:HAD superfamily hydrolase (TIGR01509 family)
MIKAVIFDVDGTLVDSVDCHAHAWQDAFRDFGHEFAFEQIRGQIGKGGDQLMPVFLSQAEIDARGDKIEAHRGAILRERYFPRIIGFPRVRELLERLRQDGKEIVLASSAKKDELSFYKRVADIAGLVEKEPSSDDAEKSKPHPDIFEAALTLLAGIDKSEVIVVGDTPYDAEAAGKAGLRTIGVLCGGFAEEELRSAGCMAIYESPAALLDQLDRSPLK